MEKYLILNWSDFEKRMCALAQTIRNSGFRPEVLFTVLWNGAVIAKQMGYLLNVSDLQGVYISFYQGLSNRKKQPEIFQSTHLNIQEKKVLLIDDISDSGHTLQEAVKILEKEKVKEYKTATLFIKPHTEYIPDFYEEKTEKWIVFPWEYGELLRKTSEELFGEITEKSLEKAKKVLKIRSSLSVSCLN